MKKYIIIFCSIFIVAVLLNARKFPMTTIALAGDVMLGRLVNEQIKQASYSYPWANSLLQELKQKDFILINLETTLTNASNPVPKVFNFKADPEVVKTLKAANITAVNLANNHSLDFGVEGLQETIKTLDEAKISHVGAGMDIEKAQEPVITEIENIKIGIIGYTDNEPEWKAKINKPGINYINIDENNIEVFEAVSKLKQKVDVCIITLHWGPNMQEYPSQEFINFAHKLIDSGADIIHGHSAHVVQGIEIYKNKIILYDTGDFVDDYMVDEKLRNDLSFLFNIEIENKKLKRLYLLPVKIENMQVNIANRGDAQTIIDMIKKRSSPFETRFEQKDHILNISI
ncbi:CapA family protein [Candidatus Dependentiae bacterium]|nr:CapA family protein [Candidatus Dependentiae bacterium]